MSFDFDDILENAFDDALEYDFDDTLDDARGYDLIVYQFYMSCGWWCMFGECLRRCVKTTVRRHLLSAGYQNPLGALPILRMS